MPRACESAVPGYAAPLPLNWRQTRSSRHPSLNAPLAGTICERMSGLTQLTEPSSCRVACGSARAQKHAASVNTRASERRSCDRTSV